MAERGGNDAAKRPEQVLSSSVLLPCGVALRHRIAKAALTEHLADPGGIPGDRLFRLYRRWARGGASFLLTGNVMVDSRSLEGDGNVVVESEDVLPALERWAAAVGDSGSQLWMQIGHAGGLSNSPEPFSPSGVPHVGLHRRFSQSRPMSEAEIRDVIRRFSFAAGLAKRAGFAGVEIHSAHGFLLNQFLSPRTNRRTDEWGGSLENRMRLLVEIVVATRDVVGPTFPVAVKLNSTDKEPDGFGESEAITVCGQLAANGVDLIEFSGGSYRRTVMLGSCEDSSLRPRREAFFLDFARRARRCVDSPIMLTGGMRSAQRMADVVSAGVVDVIGLGRPMAVFPDVPRELLASLRREVPSMYGEGIKDVFQQLRWFQIQIREMAEGRDPNPEVAIVAPMQRSVSLPVAEKRCHSQIEMTPW